MADVSGFLRYLYRISGTCLALLYGAFGLADLFFSLLAFSLGAPEANPAMAYLIERGLFVPAKIGLTALAAWLIVFVYPRGRSRPVAWGVVGLMGAINAYHVWGLSVL